MRNNPLSRVSRRGRVAIVVLTIVFLVFSLLDRVVLAWTDYLWFSHDAHQPVVFQRIMWTRVGLFLVFGLALALFLAGNLYLAFRLRPLLRPHSAEQHTLDRYRLVLTPRIGLWIGLAAALVGVFAGIAAQGQWQEWLLFRNSQSFGVADPQFHTDVSFYVFRYPFWRYLLGVGFTAVVVAVLGSLAIHYLYGGVRLQGAGERMTAAARAHLTALVAGFVLLKAVAYYLDRRGVLLSHNRTSAVDVYGGGYTDVTALLPAKEILAWISIVVAVAILVSSNAWMRNLLWSGVALGLLVVSAVAIGGIYPTSVQAFSVQPNQLEKERTFIQRSIDATRSAYDIAGTVMTPYKADVATPPQQLLTDQDTVPEIRLLDPAVVSDTFTQTQQVRGFYNFGPKLDIDRYDIEGKGVRQDYVVGVREIDYDKLPTPNWLNRHTIYTHGYGLVAAPANKLVCGGQPYFVSGFLGEHTTTGTPAAPGESCAAANDLIVANQPRVYYGERMREYAIVGKAGNGPSVEFDRPTGSANQYTTYDGKGGIDVSSLGSRLLFSLRFRETNFLLSDVFNDNSKLLFVRNPRDRVEKVAPFLTIDGDPYPAVVNNRILWILDGYTTASTYPYSQKVNLGTAARDAQTGQGTAAQEREEINYLRNSVKATVDAYDGTVTLYEFDGNDPVLKAWNKAFGGKLIRPRSDIPKELDEHWRVPEDLFKVQRDLLARFHVTNATDFFSGHDFWQVPTDPANESLKLPQPPYYLLAKFPNQQGTTFQLTAAVTPRNRQNLAALMTASYVDGKPRIEVLQLPPDNLIPGPIQVHQKMQNDPEARKDLSLFQSSKSIVEFGNLLSLPLGGGMLYIEPIYIKQNAENSYPLMKKVLLNYGDVTAYADNLPDGLKQLVAKGGTQVPGNTNPGGNNNANPGNQSGNASQNQALNDAAARVSKAIDDLRAAQKSGDFEAQGRALRELDAAMTAFKNAQQAAASPGATPTPTPSAR